MKLQILSDLHLEFAPLNVTVTEADVVVLAGDIAPRIKGVRWLEKHFADKPVVYVLGNHEFYGAVYPRLIEKIKTAARGTNIHVLENGSFSIGSVRFLGCTLWTDFALFGNPRIAGYTASQQMTDFQRIRRSPSYSKMRSLDTAVIHQRSKNWLRSELSEKWDGVTTVITHHAPSPRSLPKRFRDDILSAAYASELSELVAHSGAALWVHGHIHSSANYRIGDTRIICNPRGYPDESNPDFDPALLIDIG